MIPEEVIAEVLDRTDIVALIGRYVDLRKAGTLFKGLCPFHQERTPSFTVSPLRGTYHCFGCEVHGDALRFLMEHDGLPFPEALRALAGPAGVEVPETRPISPEERAARARRKSEEERLLEVQDKLAAFYTEALFAPTGRPARRYLNHRGVRRGAVEAFRLGYASGDKPAFRAWMEARSVARDDLALLGVLLRPDEGWREGDRLWGGYLRFRERLIFPVLDVRGEVVGFGGRVLGPDQRAAKYINSPETPIYKKGDQLYGAHTAKQVARKRGRVILCEGNVDVIALYQAGLEETVAAMGTAVTPAQVRLLKRLAPQVVCLMDGDAAGRKAAFSSLESFLEAGVAPRAVMLPPGEDPDSLIARQGVEILAGQLADAVPLLDLFIEDVSERHPTDPLGRAAALRALAPALTHVSGSLERTLYWRRVGKLLGVEPELIDTAVDEARQEHAQQLQRRRDRAAQGSARSEPLRSEPPRSEPPRSECPRSQDWGAPTGLDGPPEPGALPPHERPQSIPRLELEVVGILMQFPDEAVPFTEEGWAESLTHRGLAGFVSSLCGEVRAGRTSDRLLTELEDRGLRLALMGLQAADAVHTADTVKRALREACATLRDQQLRRKRRALLRELGASRDPEITSHIQGELKRINNELTRLGAEGAH